MVEFGICLFTVYLFLHELKGFEMQLTFVSFNNLKKTFLYQSVSLRSIPLYLLISLPPPHPRLFKPILVLDTNYNSLLRHWIIVPVGVPTSQQILFIWTWS